MRVIRGKYKGRKIPQALSSRVRPTTDKGREALFSILQNMTDLSGAHVLDLFTGSGTVAAEFASAGAARVDAIELDRHQARNLKKVMDDLGMPEINVLNRDALRYIDKTEHSYDLIFADPPYGHKDTQKIPDHVARAGILKKDGWLIIEHDAKTDLSALSNFHETRTYGKVGFSFFQFDTP